MERKEKEYAEGSAWYAQRERGAGRLRMAFMWWVYALFGKTALKIAIVPVAACIYAFAAPVRRNLRAFYAAVGQRGRLFRHVLDFAWSLADKVDACTRKKSLPQLTVRDDAGGRAFRELVIAGKGAFLISTHLGTVEVLPALAKGGGRDKRDPPASGRDKRDPPASERVPHVHGGTMSLLRGSSRRISIQRLSRSMPSRTSAWRRPSRCRRRLDAGTLY